jgi:DNA-binding response OmpR family regulator
LALVGFSGALLLARLRAAIRRASLTEQDAPIIQTTDFRVDLAAKQVTRGGGEVRLTPTEWQLVELLVRHPGRLVSQRQLLQEVWGPNYQEETNYLRLFIAQIRRKLEPDPAHPRYFITEPGMGYRFQPKDHPRRPTNHGHPTAPNALPPSCRLLGSTVPAARPNASPAISGCSQRVR